MDARRRAGRRFILRSLFLGLGLLAAVVLSGVLSGGLPIWPIRQVQEVRVSAHRYDFSPAEIRVRAGVPVRLLIISEDTDHGIVIPDLALEKMATRGRMTTLEFTPATPGRYEFQCAVECGPGHAQMTGVLIVE